MSMKFDIGIVLSLDDESADTGSARGDGRTVAQSAQSG